MMILLSVLLACAAPCAPGVVARARGGQVPPAEDSARAGAPPDAALEPWRGRLLDAAFEAASAIPVQPQIKARSRAQERVFSACLELGLPARAEACATAIADWRRGSAHADLAFWLAERGAGARVADHLEAARAIAERPPEEDDQKWRRDRIRIKIARTLLLLGDAANVERLRAGAEESEVAEFELLGARLAGDERFDAWVEALAGLVARGTFDQLRTATAVLAREFGHRYGDAARRDRIEARLRECLAKLPADLEFEAFEAMVPAAMEHGDAAKAAALVAEMAAAVEGRRWSPERELGLRARLAAARHAAGQHDVAGAQARELLAFYARHRDAIVDIERAGALRLLAESLARMGEPGAARSIYAMAIEEGQVNPNSRPRAEDLSATCVSMALRGVEPGPELEAAIAAAAAKLGEPW